MEQSKYAYLSEEKFKKNKKILVQIAIIIAAIGILIGGGLIVAGIMKKNGANNASALEILDHAEVKSNSDSSNRHNSSYMDNYNNSVRQMYGEYNNTANLMQEDFAKKAKQAEEENTGSMMIFIGIFVIMASLMAAGSILMFAHRREILAFKVQQIAPVAQEGINKITPTIANAAGAITKEITKAKGEAIRDVAGDTAKNITKGIKEGLKEK